MFVPGMTMPVVHVQASTEACQTIERHLSIRFYVILCRRLGSRNDLSSVRKRENKREKHETNKKKKRETIKRKKVRKNNRKKEEEEENKRRKRRRKQNKKKKNKNKQKQTRLRDGVRNCGNYYSTIKKNLETLQQNKSLWDSAAEQDPTRDLEEPSDCVAEFKKNLEAPEKDLTRDQEEPWDPAAEQELTRDQDEPRYSMLGCMHHGNSVSAGRDHAATLDLRHFLRMDVTPLVTMTRDMQDLRRRACRTTAQ